mmetsp:Transcript_17368/g.43731  ORF Transcript_17368/g.43731 Transcript_17368/m.43731 type:complete len:249 (-) Transcript_17368:5325-6071(-)
METSEHRSTVLPPARVRTGACGDAGAATAAKDELVPLTPLKERIWRAPPTRTSPPGTMVASGPRITVRRRSSAHAHRTPEEPRAARVALARSRAHDCSAGDTPPRSVGWSKRRSIALPTELKRQDSIVGAAQKVKGALANRKGLLRSSTWRSTVLLPPAKEHVGQSMSGGSMTRRVSVLLVATTDTASAATPPNVTRSSSSAARLSTCMLVTRTDRRIELARAAAHPAAEVQVSTLASSKKPKEKGAT